MADTVNLQTLQVTLEVIKKDYEKSFDEAAAKVSAFDALVIAGVSAMASAVAASLAAIGVASVKSFADFDDAMTKTTSTMEHMSGALKKQMEDVAISVSQNGRKSALELVEAYGALDDEGFSATQSMRALADVEEFASTNALSLAEASKSLGASMRGLKLTTDDVTQNTKNLVGLSDLLTKASIVGQGSTKEYAQALEGASINMGRFNMTAEDGVALFAALRDKSIAGAQAADFVNLTYKSLQLTVGKTKDIWDKFNLSVYDSNGQMKPLTQIIIDLDKATKGMSDENKQATLELLGFNARTAEQIKMLLGSGDAIKEYQAKLKDSTGATKDAAKIQEESFNAIWKATLKLFEDAKLVIGQQLLPIITTLIDWIKKNVGGMNEWHDAVQFVSDVLKFSLLTVIEGAMDLFYHFRVVISAGSLAIREYYEFLIQTAKVSLVAISELISAAQKYANVLALINPAAIALKSDGVTEGIKQINSAIGSLDKAFASNKTAIETDAAALLKLVDAGRPSVGFMADLEKKQEDARKAADALQHSQLEQAKAAKSASDAAKAAAEALAKQGKAATDTGVSLATLTLYQQLFAKDTETAFDKALVKVKEWEKYLQAGAISNEQFARSVRDVVSANNEFVSPVKGTEEKTGDEKEDAAIDLRNQEKVLADHYAREQADFQKHLDTMNKADTKALAEEYRLRDEAGTRYNARVNALHEQERMLQVAAAQSTFDSIANVMQTAFGKQSGMYKAAFAVTKAFAIAESLVHISAAMAKAIDTPWPANLIAMSTVAAETASIISNISSVALSFEGGGLTPSGPRSGGVDGRGGFMAVMHPDERIIDLTKDSDVQARERNNVIVNIPQTFATGVTQRDLSAHGEKMKQETLNAVIDGVSRAGAFRKGVHR